MVVVDDSFSSSVVVVDFLLFRFPKTKKNLFSCQSNLLFVVLATLFPLPLLPKIVLPKIVLTPHPPEPALTTE